MREFTQRNECSSIDSLLGRVGEREGGGEGREKEEEEEAGLREWYHIILFRKFGHTPLLWEIANSSILRREGIGRPGIGCDPGGHSGGLMVELHAFPLCLDHG